MYCFLIFLIVLFVVLFLFVQNLEFVFMIEFYVCCIDDVYCCFIGDDVWVELELCNGGCSVVVLLVVFLCKCGLVVWLVDYYLGKEKQLCCNLVDGLMLKDLEILVLGQLVCFSWLIVLKEINDFVLCLVDLDVVFSFNIIFECKGVDVIIVCVKVYIVDGCVGFDVC